MYARPQGGLYMPVPVPPPGAAAFGSSGTYHAAVTDLDVTADFGEIRLAGPNFSVSVTASGRPLPEADVLAATLDREVTRGGYTDVDGRLALHLPDSDPAAARVAALRLRRAFAAPSAARWARSGSAPPRPAWSATATAN